MTKGTARDATGACLECAFDPFVRNHFFTGKLMTARDFIDESRFHGEKMRHHNNRLHGWGVVCGLKVKAHENPACRDRFVVIESGTAIDCCGNEILLTEEVIVELAQIPAIADAFRMKRNQPQEEEAGRGGTLQGHPNSGRLEKFLQRTLETARSFEDYPVQTDGLDPFSRL